MTNRTTALILSPMQSVRDNAFKLTNHDRCYYPADGCKMVNTVVDGGSVFIADGGGLDDAILDGVLGKVAQYGAYTGGNKPNRNLTLRNIGKPDNYFGPSLCQHLTRLNAFDNLTMEDCWLRSEYLPTELKAVAKAQGVDSTKPGWENRIKRGVAVGLKFGRKARLKNIHVRGKSSIGPSYAAGDADLKHSDPKAYAILSAQRCEDVTVTDSTFGEINIESGATNIRFENCTGTIKINPPVLDRPRANNVWWNGKKVA